MYKLWLQQNSCHLRKRSKKKESGRNAKKVEGLGNHSREEINVVQEQSSVCGPYNASCVD